MRPDPALDLRLVPSALAAWSVTAAGIVWPIGPGVAVAFLACGAVGLLAARRPGGGLLRA
ncbi:MAG TPA: competence protein, partial [Mycobacterium sp.]|nr:competence protein [Mycobacterium sp.]